ncbi:MAG: TlpA family protein disulfide reductase [Candidatus Marinimicrobia bacterium]|nr:TlpA family protein disulfide reductase [Candidatus Neomarinimicrobiota bacterium]
MAAETAKIGAEKGMAVERLRPAAAVAAAALLWLVTVAAWGQQSTAATNDRNDVNVSQLVATSFNYSPFNPATVDGKIVLLDFWATWCSPCLAAFPALKALQDKFGDDNFQLISIALYSGDAEQLGWIKDEYQLTHTMLVGDANVPIVYDIIGFPTYLLMDRDGRLLRRYVGDFDDPVGRISKDVALLLNGEPIAEVSGK